MTGTDSLYVFPFVMTANAYVKLIVVALGEHAVHHQNGCPHQAFEPQEAITAADQTGLRVRTAPRTSKIATSSSLTGPGEPWLSPRFASSNVNDRHEKNRTLSISPSSSSTIRPDSQIDVPQRTSKCFTLPSFLTSPLSFYHHSGFSFSAPLARYQ